MQKPEEWVEKLGLPQGWIVTESKSGISYRSPDGSRDTAPALGWMPKLVMWMASGPGSAVAQGSLHGCLGMDAEARDVCTSLGFNMGACNWKR